MRRDGIYVCCYMFYKFHAQGRIFTVNLLQKDFWAKFPRGAKACTLRKSTPLNKISLNCPQKRKKPASI